MSDPSLHSLAVGVEPDRLGARLRALEADDLRLEPVRAARIAGNYAFRQQWLEGFDRSAES